MFGIKIASFLIVLTTLVLGGVQLKTTLLNDILHDLQEDEKKAVEAVALYPEKERNIILEVGNMNWRENLMRIFAIVLELRPKRRQWNNSRRLLIKNKTHENKK